jgi:hypothetical protein
LDVVGLSRSAVRSRPVNPDKDEAATALLNSPARRRYESPNGRRDLVELALGAVRAERRHARRLARIDVGVDAVGAPTPRELVAPLSAAGAL